jgi:hypothetical protein
LPRPSAARENTPRPRRCTPCALAIRLNTLGEDHPETASSYDNLASTLDDQGKYNEAETLLRRALAITLNTLGEDHPNSAASYNNLAVTLREQGNYTEAEAMFRRALAITLKALGEDHPCSTISYDNLASTLFSQGKYADAEALHRRALAITLKALGEDHPHAAISYNNLARTLAAQSSYGEAEAMFRRTLAIRLRNRPGCSSAKRNMRRSRTTSNWSGGSACPRVTSGGFTVVATRGLTWSWKARRWCIPWTRTPLIPGRSPRRICCPIAPPENRCAKPRRGTDVRS